ncbi:ABC transporter substrate-binding protein [Oceanimonas baumannii]|uniref:ABC transporter substrate-binding protein n=1 Tax=Oceanimonas baumannii TaxID=129578 RepID=A0A235CGJ2_9GAMM|nr:ABC transporter substrate-binding protein [Oceanimonas baumannii]OYD23660.1 ABC transporter substrate-binding protein [Oceanimonas baumannii]TDW55855.1 peptide/nickel transport system substrate-binding protein [Oceanimonas baumannii]
MMHFRHTLFGVGLLAVSASTHAAEGVLDIVAPWEIGSTDPAKAGYVYTRLQIGETLVEVDDRGHPKAGLAEGWTVSGDRLSWRFALRPEVYFHDGSALTAEAVAGALRLALTKPGMLNQAPIAEIAAEQEAVRIRLTSPFAPLPAVLAHSSAQILAPASYNEAGDATQVIGTGPYRIEQLQMPQKLIAVAFNDYWGGAPAIERVTYLAAGRGETRALLAESGDADVVFTLDPASQARLQRNPRLKVQAEPIPRTVTLKVNAGHPFLAEPEARRALSLALDRTGMAMALLRTPEAAAGQLFPPSLTDWHLKEVDGAKRDLTQARALLAGLGWQADGNGMLIRNGEPFALTMTTFSDRPELPLLATALQEQWRELGVALTVNVTNSSEIPASHRDGSLQLGLMARNFALIPDPLGTLLLDFGPEGGDWGAMNWYSPRLGEILQQLLTQTDGEVVAGLRREAAGILHEQLPVIPVAWYQQTAAVSSKVEGFRIDTFERNYRVSEMRWAQ